MATKKQKRLAGEAKQAVNRAESIRLGLLAQKKERELIERKKEQAAINRKKERELNERKKLENGKAIKNVAMAGGMD